MELSQSNWHLCMGDPERSSVFGVDSMQQVWAYYRLNVRAVGHVQPPIMNMYVQMCGHTWFFSSNVTFKPCPDVWTTVDCLVMISSRATRPPSSSQVKLTLPGTHVCL